MKKQEIIAQIEDQLEDLKLIDVEVQLAFDVLTNSLLSPMQRVILSYMMLDPKKEWNQVDVWKDLGISNKAARQNLESLAEMKYVNRGAKAGKWELAAWI